MRWIGRRRGNRRNQALQTSMADARSGEVVFISHCLLNQNTRYLGGAVCPGVVGVAIAPYVRDGTGIVQMPCPEQRVWGGVLKTRMLWLIEHRDSRGRRLSCSRSRCVIYVGGTRARPVRSSGSTGLSG